MSRRRFSSKLLLRTAAALAASDRRLCAEARDAEEERAGPDERGESAVAVVDEKKLGPEPEACAAAADEGR
jgi:hypothetical protein